MPAIHENLRLLRQAKGMTQEQVAEAIAVTRQTVSSYEQGRTRPDLETLGRLAAAYGANLEDILYGGNRRQRQLRGLRTAAVLTASALVCGLLVFAVLLWTANRFFFAAPGPVDEARRAVLEMRFAIIDAAHAVAGMATALFAAGCIVTLCLFFRLEHRPTIRMQLLWALAALAGAWAAVLPWALTDTVYGSANYFLPIWSRALPAAVLAVVISMLGDWIGRRAGK